MRDYLRAWDAIGQLLSEGRSWSGRERNCCFLNTRDGQFANIASVTGLDVPQDSRGVAVTDWDGDGDLDLWVSNRTRPRIQFWRNETSRSNHFLALRLQGTTCNRDAIGARLEFKLLDAPSSPRLVRMLKAGDGFLSQSSKWLHVGLGDYSGRVQCRIDWPDGRQELHDALTVDARYLIKQGEPHAKLVSPRQDTLRFDRSIAAKPSPLPNERSAARIVPHARLPLPDITWRNGQGQPTTLKSLRDKPVLLLLWASWCQPCLAELEQFHDRSDTLSLSQLQVVALNVERLDEAPGERVALIESMQRAYPNSLTFAIAETSTVERLDLMERCVVNTQIPLPIPAAFLIDARGRLLAIYRGSTHVDQVVHDLGALAGSASIIDRAVGLPFEGRWYLDTMPPDLMAVPGRLRQLGLLEESLRYLRSYVGTPPAPAPGVDANWYAYFNQSLTSAYTSLGVELARHQEFDLAEQAWQQALATHPRDLETLRAMASLFGQQRRFADALSVFRQMHELVPQDPIVANNLAWLLATSPVDELRDAQQAMSLAESISQQTEHRVFSALDTLAAAYANAGRYDEATKTATEALKLARQQAPLPMQQSIQARLKLYEQQQPYREPQ